MNEYDENDQLRYYQAEAEEEFDEYYPEEMYDESEEEYYPDEQYVAQSYDNYRRKGPVLGRIDPNDRTLTVVISNSSGSRAEAVVFGGNEEAAQPTGVTVDVQESSHKEVREESKSNPFRIMGMKMSVSDPQQFSNIIKINRRTSTGSHTTRTYQPRNATSPQNNAADLIDDDNFSMDVTGQDSMRVIVEDGVTIFFTFTIKARANVGNILDGRNVAEFSNDPRTTGLPQLDLIRKQQPTAFGMRPRPRLSGRPAGRPRYPIRTKKGRRRR